MAKFPETPSVKVFTLGQFRVEVDGGPLRFGQKAQRKPMELLKLLIACGGASVAVESVADSLWPEIDGDRVQGAFSTALHRLRKLIGHESLPLANARLTLDPAHCWVDCRAFAAIAEFADRAVRDGEADAAWAFAEQMLALYEGPFLDGEFDLPDILSARGKIHGLFLRHIEQLGGFFLQARQPQKAIVLYQKGLEVDELAEQLYQQLMRCYSLLGRNAEGISVYQRLREIFRTNLGIEPSSETIAIFQKLISEGLKPIGKKFTPNAKAEEKFLDFAPPFPGKPSIAVLPFLNMSGDPEQEYFSDGISEDLITALSNISRLSVVSHNTAFTYKGQAVNVKQAGQELGVLYLLKGSVRKAGNRIRITAQLIDAETDRHLWSERYDQELEDVFAVQDEITGHIVDALEVGLLDGEQAKVWRKSTRNSKAWELFMQGRHRWLSTRTRQGLVQARRLFKQAVALDAKFARAIAALGALHMSEVHVGLNESPETSLAEAYEYLSKALALDDSLAVTHGLMGQYHMMKGEHDQAIATGERALSMSFDEAAVAGYVAEILFFAGMFERAHVTIRKGLGFAPTASPINLNTLGMIDLWQGRPDAALLAFQESLAGAPDFLTSRLLLAATHAVLGQEKETKDAVGEILRIEPDFKLEKWAPPLFPFRREADLEHMLDLLRSTGLPE